MPHTEKPWWWIATLSALALALIALVTLQSRWLNELRTADQERALAHLRRSGMRITQAVDRELFSAVRLVFRGPRPARQAEFDESALIDRWTEWWEERNANSLAKALYLAEAGDGADPALRRFDPEGGILVPAEWPAGWAPLRQTVASSRRPEPGRFPFFGPTMAESGESLVVMAPRPSAPGGPFGGRWAVIEFDGRRLAGTFVPKLVEENLGEEYRYSLVRKADRAVMAGLTEKIATPDLTLQLVRGGFTGGFVGRGGAGPPAEEGAAPAGPPGLWELHLRHEAGSVAQLAAATHRRNLWLSFGVLAVMAAAMAMVVLNARRARTLARQQMDFVAAVSHELRTPIAAMRSAADNLADGLVRDEAQARRYGAMLRDQGRQLGGLVEQVLAFAGIAAHAPPKEPRPAAVDELVDQALASCAPMISSSACEVEKTIEPGLPNVLADNAWAGLALRNLVQNALVHGGGKWLRVEAHRNGTNGQPQVEIAVEDKGPGIAPADLQRIFEPFYRGQTAVKNAVRGAGLGLAIARKIAESHGGSLRAESRPGSGTRFILSLPAVKS
jgi:signal transduction histidine kinase